jgi:TPR repeat protein
MHNGRMKKYLLCLALVAGAVHADDMSDAKKAMDNKDYATALKLYAKQDKAGNTEATYQLGTMYWYGEAGAIDLVKADQLFKKAAAKGSKHAAAALEVMRKRVERKADIAFWTDKYDGSELTSGKFHCPAPRIPPMSRDNDEIQAVSKRVSTWQDCYNAFVVNLNDADPLSKRVPKDVWDLMNKQEMEATLARIQEAQTRISTDAKIGSSMVVADYAAWLKATEAYVNQANANVKNVQEAERIRNVLNTK